LPLLKFQPSYVCQYTTLLLSYLHVLSLIPEQCQCLCRSSAMHMYGPALRFGHLTDGPHARRQFATGQLDQGFPWFLSVLEQMLSQYPKSTLQWMLFMQPSPKLSSQLSAKLHAPNTIKTLSFCCPPNTKSAQMLHSSAVYCQQSTATSPLPTVHCQQSTGNSPLPTVHCQQSTANSPLPTVHCQQSTSHRLTLFTSQRFSLLPACLYQKDGRALPGNLQCTKLSWFPPPDHSCTNPLHGLFFSLSLCLSRSCSSFKMSNVTNCMWQGHRDVSCIIGTTWLAAVLRRKHPMTLNILRTW